MLFRGTVQLVGYEGAETTVYADKRPISRAEFVAAGQMEIRPAAMFIVRAAEYADQRKLRFEGKVYTVYRVYEQPHGLTELYCEVRVGGN